MIGKASILIVNGGKDPLPYRWIYLCINKILEYTEYSPYHIYVWNNNIHDADVANFLTVIPQVTLLQPTPADHFVHPHAGPLQRLYEYACQDSPQYIITLDSDTHPLQKGWLKNLVTALDEETVLAGIWRNELRKAIPPYIHPSCLCTTVDFIEKNHLRLDTIEENTSTMNHDTLTNFTETALRRGLKLWKLRRSNVKNFHRLMGGIYGNIVYHHGAGTREDISFWDEEVTEDRVAHYSMMRTTASRLLFQHYISYINWLQGRAQGKGFHSIMKEFENIGSTHVKFLTDIPDDAVRLGGTLYCWLKRIITKIPGILRIKNFLLRHVVAPKEQSKKPPLPFPAQMLHSFTPSDLRPVPQDWRVGGPDFVGIGVPKSGTSWWFSQLIEHPNIVEHRLFDKQKYLMATKEIQYFPHFGYHGMDDTAIETYRQAFAAPPGAICGDFSVQYFCYPLCTKYLSEAAPEAKIILILRNPIDRTFSHLNHLLSNRAKRFNFDLEQLYVYKTFSIYCEATLHSLYAKGLRQLLKYFNQSQILVLQYEQCITHPQQQISRTFRFLGIDDQYQPESLARKVNTQEYIVPQLTEKERQNLAEYFADDVQATVELFPEIDLLLWKDFV